MFATQNQSADRIATPRQTIVLVLPILLLVLALLSAWDNNVGHSSLLAYAFLLGMCALPAVLLFWRGGNPNIDAIAVFLASSALLLHTSLVSEYIWGWDINLERFFASGVM